MAKSDKVKTENDYILEMETDSAEAVRCKEMTKTIPLDNEDMTQVCRICSAPNSLRSIEENNPMFQLFQDITNIDVKVGNNSDCRNGICNKCIENLQQISSLVTMSLCNDGILERVIGRNKVVESVGHSDPIESNSPSCSKMEMENKTIKTEPFSCEIKEEYEDIDIKDVFVNDLVILTPTTTYQNVSDEPSQDRSNEDFTEKLNSERDSPSCFDKKLFQCDDCEKSYSRKQTLIFHLLSHSEEMPYKCDICERSFKLKHHLQLHSLIHTVEKPYKCDWCEKRFNQKKHLQQHSVIHTGEKPFKCDCCDKSFSMKNYLKQHYVIHTREKPFKCDFCEKSFKHKHNLQMHSLIHIDAKPFKCVFCEKVFNQKQHLQQHLLIHSGDKPFKCDLCEKSFTKKPTLQDHFLSHTGEKPFKCESCEKSFVRHHHLKQHLLIHTGEMPFQCDQCGKCFRFKQNLQQHLFVHSGERPFKCNFCKKNFTQRKQLLQHSLYHMGDYPNVITKISFESS